MTINDSSEPISPRRLSIGVADDNILNLKVLCKILSGKKGDEGIASCEPFKDGCQFAAKYLESPKSDVPLPFDALVLDFEMPILDGEHLARQVRAVEKKMKWARIPIIIYSSTEESPILAALLKERIVDRILKKPQKPDVLKALVRELIEEKSQSSSSSSSRL